MMRLAGELGFAPEFCGAIREEGLSRTDHWESFKVLRIGRSFPLLNGRRPFTYIRSVLSYNLALLRHLLRTRPSLIHASDIETMPACMLYRAMRSTRLVYNIHDNVAQRYNVPPVVSCVLNGAEGICVRLSSVTIVPEEFRRDALPRWSRSKVLVVRNTPHDTAFVPPTMPVNGRIRIFFGGWLDWGRGLRALLAMAERNPRIELRIAGEGSPEIVEELRAHPQVTYLGFLDHDAIMKETAECHVVPALYDPARTINRFAASNKLAEALAVGRVILINSEMAIASSLADRQCVLSGSYLDTEMLGPAVIRMVDDWAGYEAACVEARALYQERYAWGPVKQASLLAIQGT